jgi:hypothetical protein
MFPCSELLYSFSQKTRGIKNLKGKHVSCVYTATALPSHFAQEGDSKKLVAIIIIIIIIIFFF